MVGNGRHEDLALSARLAGRFVAGEVGRDATWWAGSFWARQLPPWGRLRRAPSVGGALEAAVPLPEATASTGRCTGTPAAAPPGVPAGCAAAAGRRAAMFSSEAHRAARAGRMLVAETSLCLSRASGFAFLLLVALALQR